MQTKISDILVESLDISSSQTTAAFLVIIWHQQGRGCSNIAFFNFFPVFLPPEHELAIVLPTKNKTQFLFISKNKYSF